MRLLFKTMTIHELFEQLNDIGFRIYGYADDLVNSIMGWDNRTISDRMQQALNLAPKFFSGKAIDYKSHRF